MLIQNSPSFSAWELKSLPDAGDLTNIQVRQQTSANKYEFRSSQAHNASYAIFIPSRGTTNGTFGLTDPVSVHLFEYSIACMPIMCNSGKSLFQFNSDSGPMMFNSIPIPPKQILVLFQFLPVI